MPDSSATTVLRRKLAPPRSPKLPGQARLEDMLRKTMPRDADELLGLQMAVGTVMPGSAMKQAVVAKLNPSDLTYLMKTEHGPPGICSVSTGLLSALIEMQMSGKLSSAEPGHRIPTRTDGIVGSDIVDRWVSTAKGEARKQEIEELLPFMAYFRSQMLPDTRSVDLALEPVEYRTLAISLEMMGGARKGELKFAIPPHGAWVRDPAKNTAACFRDRIIDSRARLSVVLVRMTRSIGEMRRLKAGDVLEIPIESLLRVALEGDTGEVVGTGRLGQSGGRKAILIPCRPPAETEDREPVDASDFLGAAVSGNAGTEGKVPGSETQRQGAVREVAMLGAPAAAFDVDLPDLPDLPDIGDLPDFPELPDLPDLPDFPGPPD